MSCAGKLARSEGVVRTIEGVSTFSVGELASVVPSSEIRLPGRAGMCHWYSVSQRMQLRHTPGRGPLAPLWGFLRLEGRELGVGYAAPRVDSLFASTPVVVLFDPPFFLWRVP